MTSSLPLKLPAVTPSRRRGFTLIEVLIVVGIIVLLATIALPALSKVWAASKRTQMAADLSVISQALEAYRTEFGDYPRRRTTDVTGASLLCWALVAPGPASGTSNGSGTTVPGDGADGPGFRLRGTTGAVKGPFLQTDHFTLGVLPTGNQQGMTSTPVQVIPPQAQNGTPDPIFDDRNTVIADRYFHPILYFPANKGVDPHGTTVANGTYLNNGTSGPDPHSLFNYADSFNDIFPKGYGIDTTPNKLTPRVMAFRLGNNDGTGYLAPTENPIVTGPFMLWSPGPDGLYGTADDVVDNGASVQLNTATLPPNMP